MSVDIKKVAEDLFNVVASNDELREGFLKDPMGTIKNNVKEAISEEDAKKIAEEIKKKLDSGLDLGTGTGAAAAALGNANDALGNIFPGAGN